MPSIELTLSTLEAEAAINQDGLFSGTNNVDVITSNAELYYQIPAERWQSIFKFYTDGENDVRDDTVKLFTEEGSNLIGLVGATSSSSDVSGLYQKNVSVVEVYDDYVINDISKVDGSVDDPVAALDFLSELSRKVFGSSEAIDLFSNESDIVTSFGKAIENCCDQINTMFVAQSSAEFANGAAATTSTNENLFTANQIYNQIRYSDMSRFNMMYGATSEDVSMVSGDDYAATGASGSGATVDVTITASKITNISVRTVGSGYVKGGVLTITDAASNTISLTLTDVQAHMLNGLLDDASGVEFPLFAGDKFHVKFTIKNGSGQVNAAGNQIGANAVARVIDLNIQLS